MPITAASEKAHERDKTASQSSGSADIRKFDNKTAIAVVVANMIGTGVFTSLGFQLLDIQSGFALLMLWVVGGVTALCGALTYAELGAALPRSGGEYNFLSHCYHPIAGFVSGWISSTVGFAAPVALAAITFGAYLTSIFAWLNTKALAVGLIIVLTIVHAGTRKNSAGLAMVVYFTEVAIDQYFLCHCVLDGRATSTDQFFTSSNGWRRDIEWCVCGITHLR